MEIGNSLPPQLAVEEFELHGVMYQDHSGQTAEGYQLRFQIAADRPDAVVWTPWLFFSGSAMEQFLNRANRHMHEEGHLKAPGGPGASVQ